MHTKSLNVNASANPLKRISAPMMGCTVSLIATLAIHVAAQQPSGSRLPEDLAIPIEEANDAFAEGRLDEAQRQLDRACTWLDKPANNRWLVERGIEHAFLDAMATGFQAEINYNDGKFKAAKSGVQHALKQLTNRLRILEKGRLTGANLGNIYGMRSMQAFLYALEGDIVRPIPGFGLPEITLAPGSTLGDFISRQSNKSKLLYEKSGTLIDRVVFMNPPDHWKKDIWRAYVRRFMSESRLALYKAELPNSADLESSYDYLRRAEELCTSDSGPYAKESKPYRTFVMPQREVPIESRLIELFFHNDKQAEIRAKQEWGRVVFLWAQLQSLKLELAANTDPSTRDDQLRDVRNLYCEEKSRRWHEFCENALDQANPARPRLLLARARARFAEARWIDAKQNAAGVTSLYLDCVADVRLARLRYRLTAWDKAMGDCLELAAWHQLQPLNADRLFVPQAALEQRVAELTSSLVEHLKTW